MKSNSEKYNGCNPRDDSYSPRKEILEEILRR
jgi:hypothetical protein